MSVDCTYCLEQAHRTAITLLSVLFALQFFSRNIDCTLLGFRQSQLYSFINKRLGVEVLNVTKPFIRQYICHFIPPSNWLCKKRSSYFSFYLTLFFGKCELYRCLFLHIFTNTVYTSSYILQGKWMSVSPMWNLDGMKGVMLLESQLFLSK